MKLIEEKVMIQCTEGIRVDVSTKICFFEVELGVYLGLL